MTIIEVMFAIVILSGVMLSLSRFGQSFTKAARNAANLAIASDLAMSRLEIIRGHADYSTLVATYDGDSETAGGSSNPSMTGYDGYTRATAATRTQTDTTDFVTVTVTVDASVLTSPIKKTLVIAAFP
jgi:Tfp pilus assembly protein PilV